MTIFRYVTYATLVETLNGNPRSPPAAPTVTCCSYIWAALAITARLSYPDGNFCFLFLGKKTYATVTGDIFRRHLALAERDELAQTYTPTNSSRWKIPTTCHSANYTLCCLNYNNLYLSLGNLQNGHLKILLQITAMIGANEATSLQQFRHKDCLIRILRAQDLQRNADALFLRTLMLPWIHCYKNKGNDGEQHRR